MEKTVIKKLIEESWSDYCDLDYWIQEMTRGEQRIPKHVLKMAMKHLRADLYKMHGFLCDLEEGHELKPRRPYDDDKPDGYLESDRDFLDNNNYAAVHILETLLKKT